MFRHIFFSCMILIFMLTGSIPAFSGENDYVQWLRERSMLEKAEKIFEKFQGAGEPWQFSFARPHPREILKKTSVWFDAYPQSTITRQGESIITALGDEKMWRIFKEIGIDGMHTGPLKRAGGIVERRYTPTCDGGFDRIDLDMAPEFGTDEDYIRMAKNARFAGGVVIGDVIPGHTGRGADFILATMNYGDFPGIYSMVEIKPEDWGLLPAVKNRWDTKNLLPETVDMLTRKEYIPGRLQRVIFAEPGVKDTNWSCTGEVPGVDGKTRRWVYLHYFKEGQPTLSWINPSFGCHRLLAGDVMKSLHILGMSGVRLDANGFLGLEKMPGSKTAWSEAHPLSNISTELLAMLIRRNGGFSFQELNLSIDEIARLAENGPDFSYDFITRPAYCHCLITGNADMLRLSYRLMKQYGIDSAGLIHSMQNHDEITYELVHYRQNPGKKFLLMGRNMTGTQLADSVLKTALSSVTGKNAPYNQVSGNGICTTMAGLIAGTLKINDPYRMTPAQREEVKKGHLLMVFFNAMQPGVFNISGWDMMGALPLPVESVKELTADGDYRWVNRGAYDLMGYNPGAKKSSSGMIRACCIYDSLPEQMKDSGSFMAGVKKILEIRKKYGISEARLIAVPPVKNVGVFLLIHRLPDKRIEVSAMNFDRRDVAEKNVKIKEIAGLRAVDLFTGREIGRATADDRFDFHIPAWQGRAVLFEK